MTGSPFRLINPQRDIPESPVDLFGTLRKQGVQYLWSHQDALLRAYHLSHLETSDVALELPTGAGKTLIGLLIGEFRRRARNERVVYLCPTRQLANQVEEQSAQYGIASYALVGPKRDFDPEKFNAYASGQAIAITTYSGLFNTSPRFEDPNLVICDDAHSAENYVSSLWSTSIRRDSLPFLYYELLDLLANALPRQFVTDMREGDGVYGIENKIDCVPLPLIHSYLDGIRDLISERLEADGSNERWGWSLLRDNLYSCQIYVTWREIYIRPIIPPTFLHAPFSRASQRLYMSATLGEGGEFERSLGVEHVERMPIAEGWEDQANGRRLLLFPSLSLEPSEVEELVCSTMALQPRTLVLCPDTKRASDAEAAIGSCSKQITILRKNDIEESLEAFTNAEDVALVLTSRYDGIDLPDDTCRLQVVYEEPSAVNLQERFYLSRLGADVLFRDRIRTRIAQSLGRCVRNANDYALILMVGEKLSNFCSHGRTLAGLHPELQAEFQFGLSQSQEQSSEGFLEMARMFFAVNDQWQEAESYIRSRREDFARETDASAAILANAALFEVRFGRALWNRDFEGAQRQAQEVIDLLSGEEFAPYRSWWHYLAGTVAWLRYSEHGDQASLDNASNHFRRAISAASTISWLSNLQAFAQQRVSKVVDEDGKETLSIVLDNLWDELQRTPFQGPRFEQKMQQIIAQLNDTGHSQFEQGIEALGKILGYVSNRPNEEGAPDGVWEIPGHLFIVFEAKTEQSSEGTIGRRDVQQAKGHVDWLRRTRDLEESQQILPVLISPRTEIDESGLPHIDGLHIISPNLIPEIGVRVVEVLRAVRALYQSADNLAELRETLHRQLEERGLLPENIVGLFTG